MLKRIMELLFALAVLAGLLFAGDKVRTYVSVQQENVRRNLVIRDTAGRTPGRWGRMRSWKRISTWPSP